LRGEVFTDSGRTAEIAEEVAHPRITHGQHLERIGRRAAGEHGPLGDGSIVPGASAERDAELRATSGRTATARRHADRLRVGLDLGQCSVRFAHGWRRGRVVDEPAHRNAYLPLGIGLEHGEDPALARREPQVDHRAQLAELLCRSLGLGTVEVDEDLDLGVVVQLTVDLVGGYARVVGELGNDDHRVRVGGIT